MIGRKLLSSLAFAATGGGAWYAGAAWQKRKMQEDEMTASDDLSIFPSVTARTAPSNTLPAPLTPPITNIPSKTAELVKHGFPSTDNLKTFGDFILSYDRRNRTANWVLEHLTREKVKPGKDVTRESSEFFVDESVNDLFRPTNEDYKKSGYDRGHLAAAANHRWSQQAMDQTFVLSNISPQVGKGFNRDAWAYLEKYARALTKTYKDVYVCTGPLYLPRREADNKLYVKYEVIGKHHVSVPTHFFKVILGEDGAGAADLLCFVMPNQALPDNVDLKSYLMPLEAIERASGLLFFDRLAKRGLRKVNGKSV